MSAVRPAGRLVAALAIACLPGAALAGPAAATTIPVNTTSDESTDNATCSLREAVTAANANANAHEDACPAGAGPGLDTITLAASSTYNLSGAGADDANASGDLDVLGATAGPLEVQGGGAGSTTVSGGMSDRAFDVRPGPPGGALTLDSLQVANSTATGPGAGIRVGSGGSLALESARVSLNFASGASGDGGGIYASNPSTVTATDSQIDNNTATGNFGGGGIFSLGTVSLSGTDVQGNDATGSFPAGGGGLYLSGFDTTIEDGSEVDFNTSTNGFGGGIANQNSSLTITDSVIADNQANAHSGGGIYNQPGPGDLLAITDSEVSSNDAGLVGAGVFHADPSSSLEITRSSISQNTITSGVASVLSGGGLAAIGPATITDSAVSGNAIVETDADPGPLQGAGIDNSDNLTLRRSTVSGNTMSTVSPAGATGGGLYSEGAVTAVNSTFTGNEADDEGGGIWSLGSSVELVHATIAANSAPDGPAIGAGGAPALAAVTLDASIVADGATACEGPVTSVDDNVDVGTSCGFSQAHDQPGTDPTLAPLADNGGATETMALPAASPVANDVAPGRCDDEDGDPLAEDQRGLPRPGSSGCEPGAYEIVKCRGALVDGASILGTAAPETLLGTPGPDVLVGLGGADVLKARDDDDRLCGYAGRDKLRGGLGIDRCDGGRGRDRGPGCEKRKSIP